MNSVVESARYWNYNKWWVLVFLQQDGFCWKVECLSSINNQIKIGENYSILQNYAPNKTLSLNGWSRFGRLQLGGKQNYSNFYIITSLCSSQVTLTP